MAERDPNELGALWLKEGRKGQYMTGTIAGQRVVIFKNTRKSSDKAPDFRVLKAQSKEERGAPAPPDDEVPW